MAKFWQDLGFMSSMDLTDKLLVGKNADGSTQYTDLQTVYNKISQVYFADEKPSVIAAGSVLTNPNSLTCHIAPAGTYTLPSGNVTLTGNINFFFWDFSAGWSWQSFFVQVGTSNMADASVTAAKLDVTSVYALLSQMYFVDTKPSVIAAGSVLTTPTSLTCYIAPAGTYTLPSGNITLTGNINFLFWDFSAGWTWQSFSIDDVYTKDEIEQKATLSFNETSFPEFIGFPVTQPSVDTETDTITLNLSGSTSDFGVAITSQEMNYIELDFVKSYVCVGINSAGNPILVCVQGGSFCGQIRTISNTLGYNLSNNLGTLFPSTGIPTGAKIRVQVAVSEVSIYYSTDNRVTWSLWGSLLKSNFPTPYLTQKLGFLGYKTDTNNAVKIYKVEYRYKTQNKIDKNTIQTVSSAKNMFVPIIPVASNQFDSNIRKVSVQDFFDSNEKLVFRNPPAILYSIFPVTSTIVNTDNSILVTPTADTSFACFFSSFELTEIVISRANSYAVIGVDSDGMPIIIAFDGGIAGQIRKFKTGTGYNLVNNIAVASNTTNIPSNALKVKIQVSSTAITISYTTDGITYVLWNTILKTNVGTTYALSKLGALTYLVATSVYNYKVGSSGTGVVLTDNFLKTERRNSTKLLVIDEEKEGGAGYINISRTYDNKKGFCYGDSISTNTEGANLYYAPVIQEKLGLMSCLNFGVGGKTLANDLSKSTNIANIINASPDIVFILGGTNDFGGNIGAGSPLGTESDMNNGTTSGSTLGGLAYILGQVQTALPSTRIVVITPIPRFYGNLNEMYTANSQGLTLLDYVQGIKNVARRYSCISVDAYAEIGINKYNQATYLKDTVHPNQAGYRRLCEIISTKVC